MSKESLIPEQYRVKCIHKSQNGDTIEITGDSRDENFMKKCREEDGRTPHYLNNVAYYPYATYYNTPYYYYGTPYYYYYYPYYPFWGNRFWGGWYNRWYWI